MKSYTITVNGNVYDVTVEETTEKAAVAMPKAPVKAEPVIQKEVPAKAVSKGSIEVKSPMPGKILAVKTEVGQAVKKGEVILILEAMKMENEVVAPEDGMVVSVNVAVGDSVEASDVLATLN